MEIQNALVEIAVRQVDRVTGKSESNRVRVREKERERERKERASERAQVPQPSLTNTSSDLAHVPSDPHKE